ncbi:MAG: DUF3089 domain-containing protein [Caulobacteraceae bacterium]
MTLKRRTAIIAAAVLVVLAVAGFAFRGDILRSWLDPQQPYQTYRPPPAPDYARRGAWALMPAEPVNWTLSDPSADVFFIHPTTYAGGRHWNAPIDDKGADRILNRVMLPNYAGPFLRVGRVFAPRYRQASLYTWMTLRDDAREARQFAYRDVKAAFDAFVSRYNGGRPIIIAGVEQGGELAARLATDAAADPKIKARLVAVYAMRAIVPAPRPQALLPACGQRDQARCIVAFANVPVGEDAKAVRTLNRALVWGADGRLEELGTRPALCVNPLTGATGEAQAPAEMNLGAANATGLEWGVRPGFLPRQVSAQCMNGLLRASLPASQSLRREGGWAERQMAPNFNPFFADTEADAKARVGVLIHSPEYVPVSPPIGNAIVVRNAPIHRID